MLLSEFEISLIGLILILIIFLIIKKIKIKKLISSRDILLQEKEVTLGFVQNVGEVFADSETVEMNLLLERVLHYAVRTCKAGSGAIYLINNQKNKLSARAISGVFPPLFEIESEFKEGISLNFSKVPIQVKTYPAKKLSFSLL